jgi:hypothetical protein
VSATDFNNGLDLSGWWIVWRYHSNGTSYKPVAAFASRAMALEWKEDAPHRKDDKLHEYSTHDEQKDEQI